MFRMVWGKQGYCSITIIWDIKRNRSRILGIKWCRQVECNGIKYTHSIYLLHQNFRCYSTPTFYSWLGGVVAVDQWEFPFIRGHFLLLPTFLCETITDAKSDRFFCLHISNSDLPLLSQVCLSSHNCEFY